MALDPSVVTQCGINILLNNKKYWYTLPQKSTKPMNGIQICRKIVIFY